MALNRSNETIQAFTLTQSLMLVTIFFNVFRNYRENRETHLYCPSLNIGKSLFIEFSVLRRTIDEMLSFIARLSYRS